MEKREYSDWFRQCSNSETHLLLNTCIEQTTAPIEEAVCTNSESINRMNDMKSTKVT